MRKNSKQPPDPNRRFRVKACDPENLERHLNDGDAAGWTLVSVSWMPYALAGAGQFAVVWDAGVRPKKPDA